MTYEELGDVPPYIAKRMEIQREVAAIVAEATPQPEPADHPAGHFTKAPAHEVAAYLATFGRHSSSYRPEH